MSPRLIKRASHVESGSKPKLARGRSFPHRNKTHLTWCYRRIQKPSPITRDRSLCFLQCSGVESRGGLGSVIWCLLGGNLAENTHTRTHTHIHRNACAVSDSSARIRIFRRRMYILGSLADSSMYRDCAMLCTLHVFRRLGQNCGEFFIPPKKIFGGDQILHA